MAESRSARSRASGGVHNKPTFRSIEEVSYDPTSNPLYFMTSPFGGLSSLAPLS